MKWTHWRRRLHRLAQRISVRLDPEDWRVLPRDEDSAPGIKLQKRNPVRFHDVTMLTRLLDSLAELHTGPVHIYGRDGTEARPHPGHQAAMYIASFAPADRSEINISASAYEAEPASPAGEVYRYGWSVKIGSAGKPEITVLGSDNSSAWQFARSLRHLVDLHTVKARGLSATSPVVEPIDLATASQRDHDAAVAQKAARIGAVWGAVAGAIFGGVATLVVQFLGAGS